MMWPFKRHPYPRPGPIRRTELLGELDACSAREDAVLKLFQADLISSDEFLAATFKTREDEIETLRDLHWTTEADRKQADLDMRKGWVAEPLTPLVDGGAFTQAADDA